jgi:hypothetical protein
MAVTTIGLFEYLEIPEIPICRLDRRLALIDTVDLPIAGGLAPLC